MQETVLRQLASARPRIDQVFEHEASLRVRRHAHQTARDHTPVILHGDVPRGYAIPPLIGDAILLNANCLPRRDIAGGHKLGMCAQMSPSHRRQRLNLRRCIAKAVEPGAGSRAGPNDWGSRAPAWRACVRLKNWACASQGRMGHESWRRAREVGAESDPRRGALYTHLCHAATRRFRVDNKSAEVSIEDSGPGIPTDKVARLFEPFFTTKDTGYGHGSFHCS